jgi:hypothetical protein
MKLSVAEGLKEEVLSALSLRLGKRGDGEERWVAVGIAPGTASNYRIAVRPRFTTDLVDIRDYLEDATGGEIDIRVTGPITPAGCCVVTHGASVSRAAGGRTGSIGFFARRSSDGVIGFVSNNHILAAEDAGKEGDEIIHPGRADKKRGTPRVIGYLDGAYPSLRSPGPTPVDCAFARLVGVTLDAEPLGDPVRASGDLAVYKVGRSTGRTEGRVTAFALDRCRVDYASGPVTFRGQIEIESTNQKPFSSSGDSGSLILTDDRQPLGLLCSCSAAGGTFNSGLTYANPISAIMETLGVAFLR